jgi:hypothetical protein
MYVLIINFLQHVKSNIMLQLIDIKLLYRIPNGLRAKAISL